MKIKLWFSLFSLLLILLVIGFACSKSSSDKSQVKNANCNPPDYGDSIIYVKFKGPSNDFTVKPKNTTVTGTYYSWPEGLSLNASTGEINVSKSETGVRYNIGFVETGTHDTCVTQLILGGITYVDSIYVMEKNDTLAYPYYYANPNAAAICDKSDDTDYPKPGQSGGGNNKCEFDDNSDPDGNGVGDEPPAGAVRANDQNVRVRTLSGVINLKKTLLEGAFGTNPQNGASKLVTIYYRLNDFSGRALQKISVQLYYYDKVSSIPSTLMTEIADKRQNFFDYRIIRGKPRPPMIILTSFAQ